MAIFLLKDVSLRTRLIFAFVMVGIIALISVYAYWERQQYREGHRKLDSTEQAQTQK